MDSTQVHRAGGDSDELPKDGIAEDEGDVNEIVDAKQYKPQEL